MKKKQRNKIDLQWVAQKRFCFSHPMKVFRFWRFLFFISNRVLFTLEEINANASMWYKHKMPSVFCMHFFQPLLNKWWIIKRNIYCFDFSFIPKTPCLSCMCVWNRDRGKKTVPCAFFDVAVVRRNSCDKHKKKIPSLFCTHHTPIGRSVWYRHFHLVFWYATANIWTQFLSAFLFSLSKCLAHIVMLL